MQGIKLHCVSFLSGANVQLELYPLLKTWIIIIYIMRTVMPERLPADFRDLPTVLELLVQLSKSLQTQGFAPTAMEIIFARLHLVCIPVSDKYQHVCRDLELGTSWEEVVAKMYGVHHQQDSFGIINTHSKPILQLPDFSNFGKSVSM